MKTPHFDDGIPGFLAMQDFLISADRVVSEHLKEFLDHFKFNKDWSFYRLSFDYAGARVEWGAGYATDTTVIPWPAFLTFYRQHA